MTLSINIYRYNPEKDKFPYMQSFEFEKPKEYYGLRIAQQLKEKILLFHTDDPAEKEFVAPME